MYYNTKKIISLILIITECVISHSIVFASEIDAIYDTNIIYKSENVESDNEYKANNSSISIESDDISDDSSNDISDKYIYECYNPTYEDLQDADYYKYFDENGNKIEYQDKNIDNGLAKSGPVTTNSEFGCDVSKWQGNIDWSMAKAAGVNFAIIKVGGRGRTDGILRDDEKYIQNIQGALNAGIKVGVYVYSEAISISEAIEEAKYLIDRVYMYHISLPLVIDYEGFGPEQRIGQAGLSKEQHTEIVSAFCETIRNAGYTPMIYSSASFFESYMDGNSLASKYRLWIASHSNVPEHYTDSSYSFWQYAVTGDTAYYGMNESSGLDLDYWYNDGAIDVKDYSLIFNAEFYANENPDIKNVYGTNPSLLLNHFLNFGISEGRQANDSFDVHSYKSRYADLRNIFGNNLALYYYHYMNYGYYEGRNGKKDTNKYCVQFIQEGQIIDSQEVEFGYAAKAPVSVKNKNGATIVYDKSFDNITGDLVVNVTSKYLYNGQDYTSVFDADYYLNENSDIKQAYGNDGAKALYHFVNWGMNEGRRGNEAFDVYSYKGRYADLRKAFGNNIKSYYQHFIGYGINEGRTGDENKDTFTVTFMNGSKKLAEQKIKYGHSATAPGLTVSGGTASWSQLFDCVTDNMTISLVRRYVYNGIDYTPVFDAEYYLNKYADLKKAFGNDGTKALSHFVNWGIREGRQAKESFNVTSYRNGYSDLRHVFGGDIPRYYMHYITNGQYEGRISTGNETTIFGAQTVYKGTDYSSVYDFNYYVTKNPDILRAFGYDENRVLEHFVLYGIDEGRVAKSTFNVEVYEKDYDDLRRVFGNNARAYYMHYMNYGIREGRVAV